MPSLDTRIALAERHVKEGRRVVEQQRLRVASGASRGLLSRSLLATFERSLALFEQDLARLLREREK